MAAGPLLVWPAGWLAGAFADVDVDGGAFCACDVNRAAGRLAAQKRTINRKK